MSQDWTPINREDRSTLPPEGEVVETMDSGGHVQELVFRRNLFWLTDMSMYVYYVPSFWRKRTAD